MAVTLPAASWVDVTLPAASIVLVIVPAVAWLARRFGRPFAEKWISSSTLDRWDKSSAGQGIPFYVVTLVMPFFPNDAMCYVAGLGSISFRRFLVANIIGRGIASCLTVMDGALSDQIPSMIWIAIVVFVVLGIVGWAAARRYGKPADA